MRPKLLKEQAPPRTVKKAKKAKRAPVTRAKKPVRSSIVQTPGADRIEPLPVPERVTLDVTPSWWIESFARLGLSTLHAQRTGAPYVLRVAQALDAAATFCPMGEFTLRFDRLVVEAPAAHNGTETPNAVQIRSVLELIELPKT